MSTRIFSRSPRGAILLCLAVAVARVAAGEVELRVIRPGAAAGDANLVIRADQPSHARIPPYMTGKFAEHLGANIYNGMDAQILRNPTFADWPFSTGQTTPDGVMSFHWEADRINTELRRQAARAGWRERDMEALVQGRSDGLACFWMRVGDRGDVAVSPDAGPVVGRAQRVEVRAAGQGVAQWVWLPLHRQRRYELELLLRSPDIRGLVINVGTGTTNRVWVEQPITGVDPSWRMVRSVLEMPADAPADEPYRIAITASQPGQFVIQRALLRPADHVRGADPDIIRLLKESRLPLLRWPGGNFVSGYQWQDGVGPLEGRATRPNYAWGGVEPNLFGTAEFIDFCRAVGCDPMICINAASATPEDAARWVEYCNGPVSSPMGALRAAHGRPEPFAVRHWEVGNELWGRWQFHWTTARGNVDRYRQFAAALKRADPAIQLYACGAPVFWGKDWNDTLIAGLGADLRSITDHPLIGGNVPLAADPLEVYRDFMAVPEVLSERWEALRGAMTRGGVVQPRLAVTELQLFAHLGPKPAEGVPVRLTGANLPGQGSITEAIYDVLVYHAAARLGDFVEMITHSAVVNHGGGLRKDRERVYANPCHHAQSAFAAMAGAELLPVVIECALDEAPRVLPDLHNASPAVSFGVVDALAARAQDGALLVSLVHRGTAGPVRLHVKWEGFKAGPGGTLRELSARNPWEGNTREEQERVRPIERPVDAAAQSVALELPAFSVSLLRIPRGT